jgi:phthalate 4,5-dioxygenase
MLSKEENELLCLVEGHRPMGSLIKRYWLPAIESAALESDGAPRQVVLLGERYVAFRDTDGNVGFLDEFCPHRGASLVLARNEDCALQCLYHGWRVDHLGNIVETPSEPDDSTFKQRIKHKAYPVAETGGVVWVYLGPAELRPAEPEFGFSGLPPEQHHVVRTVIECNWVQALEGVIDTAHIMFLHADVTRPDWFGGEARDRGDVRPEIAAGLPSIAKDARPKIVIEDTNYGFRYAGIRATGQPGTLLVRASHYVTPFFGIFPGAPGWGYMQGFVPTDDFHTVFYFWFWRTDGGVIDDEDRAGFREYSGFVLGTDIDEAGNSIPNQSNWWRQDRDAMRRGDSFTGIRGVNREDFAVLESMGGLYDRSREHLGTSDVAVIRMRRLMLDNVRSFIEGGTPFGLERPLSYRTMRGNETLLGADEPWQAACDGSATELPAAGASV